jgi:hypothetical protein
MKRLLCALVALSLVGGLAGPVAAADGYTKKKANKKKRAAKKRESSAGTYIERDADKLPYGTWTWWEQMDREGRGGQQSGGSGFD